MAQSLSQTGGVKEATRRRWSKKQAVRALVLAAAAWGMGFITSVWAMRGIPGQTAFGPASLASLRLFCAGLVQLGLWWRGGAPARGGAHHTVVRRMLKSIRLGAAPGVFLGAGLTFQLEGLRDTTATKSGFITSLYVVFVPVTVLFLAGIRGLWALDWEPIRRSLPRMHHWGAVGLAILGTYLLCGGGAGLGGWNRGDAWTLLCSLAFTAHFLVVDAVMTHDARSGAGGVDPACLNAAQMLVAGVVIGLWTSVFGEWQVPGLSAVAKAVWVWPSFLFLVLAASVWAFGAQLKAQEVLPPFVVSLLCLLESVFSAVFAMAFLGEFLTPTALLGASGVLMSAVVASWSGHSRQSL